MYHVSRRISALLLTILFFIVVFDPSDSLTGLKKHVFIALMYWWLLLGIGAKKPPRIIPASLLIFFCFGLVFPSFSILSYYLQNGNFSEYEGFKTLIGFLSLALLIPISSLETPTLRLFIKVLTVQVVVTLGLYICLSLNPFLVKPVTFFGYDKGFLWINSKNYGSIQFLQIFFKTAPFMVFPAAYYSAKYFSSSRDSNGGALILLVASCIALLISGTRANMAFAVIIPGYFATRSLKWASPSHRIFIIFALCAFLGLFYANAGILITMLNPSETSNAVKLGYWHDYVKIFSDPIVLFFGQGIGAVHYFDSLGMKLRITEVTLLELVRKFGLIIAFAYLVFWITPLILLRQAKFRDCHWLRVAYASYLLISMSNYYILSSTGMVLLSVVYGECLGHVNHSTLRKKGISASARSVLSSNADNAP